VKWVPERRGFDEAFDAAGTPRRHYRALISMLESFTQTEVDGCRSSASSTRA